MASMGPGFADDITETQWTTLPVIEISKLRAGKGFSPSEWTLLTIKTKSEEIGRGDGERRYLASLIQPIDIVSDVSYSHDGIEFDNDQLTAYLVKAADADVSLRFQITKHP